MRIIQVCVGRPAEIRFAGKVVETGIFKSPRQGSIELRSLNLDGDGQADLTVHGGRNKAIYVYASDHYDYWVNDPGIEELDDAQFGENLTVSGFSEEEVIIGDRYRIGSAMVMRAGPCSNYRIWMRDGYAGCGK